MLRKAVAGCLAVSSRVAPGLERTAVTQVKVSVENQALAGVNLRAASMRIICLFCVGPDLDMRDQGDYLGERSPS